MLPFSKNDKKKYTCFVCDQQFIDFNEFKQHILDKHEEGREFLVCPQCEAPLRDMHIHYKAIHPRDKIPEHIQTKALIWKDFSKGKSKTKKPAFHGGQFVSMKNNGQLMNYRSGWELQVYECLEDLPNIEKYEVESLKIPYYWMGKWRNYFPDLLLHYADGSKEIWEIKPSNQTSLDQNHAKWNACNDFCLKHGHRFVVQTEKGIQLLKIQRLNELKGLN